MTNTLGHHCLRKYEEQLKDPELKHHWQSVKKGNVLKAINWIRMAACNKAVVKVSLKGPAKPVAQRIRVKIPDPLVNLFNSFYIAKGKNISLTEDVTIDQEFEGLSYKSQLQKLSEHCNKTPALALESFHKRIGRIVKKLTA